MSRIQATFDRLRAAGRQALIPYVTVGDPDLATTAHVLDALVEAGADLIELGVPFSDPMADGPVIQAAMVRALEHGVTLADCFDVAREFRERHAEVPLVLFGYLNPLFRYGLERACADAAASGVDGLLVVDLPPEEADELTDHSRPCGLDHIALFTPTSDEADHRCLGAEDTSTPGVQVSSTPGSPESCGLVRLPPTAVSTHVG